MSGPLDRHFCSLVLLLSLVAPAAAADLPGEVRASDARVVTIDGAPEPPPAVALDPAATPIVQLVLLRNGEVLAGQVTRTTDGCVVALSDGEIQVRAAKIEAVCRDLPECYRFKRDRITTSNVNDYLALVEWCLRHGLIREATVSFHEASELDPHHPKLAVLERRLQLAANPSAPTPSAPAKLDEQISTEELDRTVRAMPPKSMEQFTTTIQPLLLNNCSTGGCHGPQSATSYRLLRLPPNRTANRRSTQRNLSATLALINREHPGQSALLTAPIKPHGAAAAPIFGKHQSNQYLQLMEWVALVAGKPVQSPWEEEESGERPAGATRRAAAATRAMTSAGQKQDASSERGSAERRSAEPLPLNVGERKSAKVNDWPAGDVQPASAMEKRKPAQRGAAVETFVPEDEFDPAIFNRGAAAPGAP